MSGNDSRRWGGLACDEASDGVLVAAVRVSIGSFVAVQLQSNPAPWEPWMLNRSRVRARGPRSRAALVVERRPSATWLAQGAGGRDRVCGRRAVKLYTAAGALASVQSFQWGDEALAVAVGALAFGLIGSRVQAASAKLGFAVAGLIALGSASYSLSWKLDLGGEVWYLVAERQHSLPVRLRRECRRCALSRPSRGGTLGWASVPE